MRCGDADLLYCIKDDAAFSEAFLGDDSIDEQNWIVTALARSVQPEHLVLKLAWNKKPLRIRS